MHPNQCRVACDAESCKCTPTRQELDTNTPDIADRLSDEADLCRNDGANDIAKLLEEAAATIDYYRAIFEKRTPAWLPVRVSLPDAVCGKSAPFDADFQAGAGAHFCESNHLGAVSIKATNGRSIGLGPGEFVPLEWRRNEVQ